MADRPDFSPVMLRLFLRCRAALVLRQAQDEGRSGLRGFKDALRRAARVSRAEFAAAWAGRLEEPLPRARLWGALGHVPEDVGMHLVFGGQERFTTPHPAASRPPSPSRGEGSGAEGRPC